MALNQLFQSLKELTNSPVMPVLFIGHGSPMNVLPNSPYYESWRALGDKLGKPQAILCISAHWTTHSTTSVATTSRPQTIYDFYNFPSELYQLDYPVDGAPATAQSILNEMQHTMFDVHQDNTYGLDHGSWCILKPMFPEADIPVFQLSIAINREPQYHYKLGQALRFLRRKGVLIIGSGNIVHNLRALRINSRYDWAEAFDDLSRKAIDDRNDKILINFKQLDQAAQLSINSAEHYYPLLYTLGLREDNDDILQFNDHLISSISMRSVIFSPNI